MPLAGQNGIKIREFGGLNTLLDPTNCPIYMSPDCLDVEFFPQTVKSRPPLRSILNGGGLATAVNYLKTFVKPNGDVQTLWMDDIGDLFYEDVTHNAGVAHLITSNAHPNSFPNSVTMFGREFIAIGDGIKGTGIPCWWDGATFDRISHDGPGGNTPFSGASMICVDNVSVLTVAIGPTGLIMVPAMNIQSASEVGDICTVTVTWFSAIFLACAPGDMVRITGAGGYNGDFPILTIAFAPGGGPTATLTYQNPTTGLAPIGAVGTASIQTAKVVTTTPHGLPVNTGSVFSPAPQVTIATSPVAGYNGTWEVRNVSDAVTMYVVTASFGLAASGSPGAPPFTTVTVIGHVVAGHHEAVVMFEYANGYITQPSPIVSWDAVGNKRVKVSGVPIGPPGVVARIIAFTPVNSGDFYYIPTAGATAAIPSTRIPDNTTTTAIFDFSDDDLLNGVSANDFFDLVTLPPVAAFAEYKSRLIAVGALAPVDNFNNLSFDGGFSFDLLDLPLSWAAGANWNGNTPGKSTNSLFGFAYQLTGNASPIVGEIYQSAYQDSLGLPILEAGKGYTISAYFKKSNVMLGVVVKVRIRSVSAGYDAGITANLGSQVFIGQWTQLSADIPAIPTPVPSDLQIYIQMEGANIGDFALVDEIMLVPTANPTQNSTALVSYAEQPEAFNSITGLLQPAEENGQRLTAPFVIRDFLYLSKERSLFVTQDNEDEPSTWTIDEVSKRVGTLSFRGVGIGDEWALIAAESGLWFFTGGILADENKFSVEVQPTWDGLNWLKGFLIDVKVDTKRKRAYINVPLAGSPITNQILTLDYVQGWADSTNNDGAGRKWSPWAISANSQNLLLRQTDTIEMCFGENAADINVYQLDVTFLTNQPRDAHWESGYFQDGERLNFGYVTANVSGVGLLGLILRRGDQSWYKPIREWILKNVAVYTNAERVIQQQGYRMAIRFGTSNPVVLSTDAVNFFSLQNLVMYVRPADYAPVRGINA